MHLAPGSGSRELTSGNYTNSEPLTRGNGLWYASEGIVIREGDRGETGGERPFHHRFRPETSI